MSTNESEFPVKQESEGANKSISRRSFLKILGSASAAAGLAGCADRPTQNILPNVNGQKEQIPGLAVWYSSTCTECSAGCGIHVRTREGRAVKVEGNSDHPLNRGGLCALGQASLQSLYDPDRVRHPMLKEAGADGRPAFKAISWDEALAKVAEAVKGASGKQIFLTGETSGALDELLNAWCTKFGVEQASFDLMQQTNVAKAAELVYGTYGIPTFAFDKAEVVVNFGADFLETWISPCEYARDWSKGRKSEKPIRVVHVEPRLSLTGANADLWMSARPGTELHVALVLLKLLLERGRGQGLRDDIRASVETLVKDVSLDDVVRDTGVAKEKILLAAQYLGESKSSLVLAGGASTATENPLPLLVAVNFLNLLLSNVGTTVKIAAMRKSKSSPQKITSIIETLNKGTTKNVFVYGTNPLYTLPASFGLEYAMKKADFVVAFSSHMDETAQAADLVLPPNTALESWGDVRNVDGVNSLQQPAMAPVFDTKHFGDMLLSVATLAGDTTVSGGATSYEAYLKESWKKLHSAAGVKEDFAHFWVSSVERGGYFETAATEDRAKVKVDTRVFDSQFMKFKEPTFDRKDLGSDDLILFPFPSVKSFDGRAANRPWLQEIPDPITQIAWDAWAEIHPETAKKRGIAQGDFIAIGNFYGQLNVPVYVTPYVQEGIVAVPIGQGHRSYGRYAQSVKGGNALDLLPAKLGNQSGGVALLSTRVWARRGRGDPQLVITQGSNSQMGRELARTTFVAGALDHVKNNHAEEGHGANHGAANGGHSHHEEPKQMYVQRQHPLHHWGMVVDLAACTGCSACVVACYAENNIPVVGKQVMHQGREMSWLRIERYYEGGENGEELQVSFLPMMCQHCGNAPCEPVCPVYATYHNEEGLNSMVYNRCVGTRYCSNNCSYKVRRFNWFDYEFPETLTWQLNPDVTKRGVGIMEKCTFCVQRIAEGKDRAKDLGRGVADGEIKPACVQSCPTEALTFGDLNDPSSRVSKMSKEDRAYKVLDHHINTQPSISYLENIRYKA